MSSDSQSSEEYGEEYLQYQNRYWRNYRRFGNYEYQDESVPTELPNPEPLLFFENIPWTPAPYQLPFDSFKNTPDPDVDEGQYLRWEQVHQQYNEMRTLFGQPRYTAQKLLGAGGNGLAAHFQDHGPENTNVPGGDIVVKGAVNPRQQTMIDKEKKMLRVSCLISRDQMTS